MIWAPFRVGRGLYRDVLPIFKDGVYEQLVTVGSELYHPLWRPLIVFEVVGNAIMIVFPLVVLAYVLRRSRHAPKVAIAWFSASVVFVGIDYLLAQQIPLIAKQAIDFESVKPVVGSFVAAAIWIPYYLVSKRVKATLTR